MGPRMGIVIAVPFPAGAPPVGIGASGASDA